MKPLHRFTVPGYGPVVVRGLERGEVELITAEADGDAGVAWAAFVRKGSVRPDVFRMSDDELQAEFARCPDALVAIGDRVVAESWHAGGES